jgi:hypothetical protein
MPWSPLSSGTKIHTETRIASVATAQGKFQSVPSSSEQWAGECCLLWHTTGAWSASHAPVLRSGSLLPIENI